MELSVIIPVYNDPEGLRDTLESLVDQDFDGRYEVLPVDNNSTDCTGEVIREFEESYPDLVRGLEENEVQSSYAARNKGVVEAEGSVLCFVDADMWVDSDWLSSINEFMDENSGDYVGCNVETVISSDSFASLYNSLKAFDVERYLESERYAPTCCLVVRNRVFDEVGDFDDRLVSGGDKEFGQRVFSNGFEQSFAEQVFMYHPARNSVSSTLNKSIRVGKGLGQLKGLYPSCYSDRSVLDPRNFLPPNPFGMNNVIRGWESLRRRHKVGVYLLEYLRKLGMSFGKLKYYLFS